MPQQSGAVTISHRSDGHTSPGTTPGESSVSPILAPAPETTQEETLGPQEHQVATAALPVVHALLQERPPHPYSVWGKQPPPPSRWAARRVPDLTHAPRARLLHLLIPPPLPPHSPPEAAIDLSSVIVYCCIF